MEYGVKNKQTETLNFPYSIYRDRTQNSEFRTPNSELIYYYTDSSCAVRRQGRNFL